MPRECTICSHTDRAEIEDAVVVHSQAKRRVATQHGVTEQSLRRHLKEHLPELLALARDAERYARADSLLDRVEDLQRRTEEALAKAEEAENLFATFRGISEMRRNLELIGEVTKELNRTPTLNLQLNPQYIAVRTAIVQAVEPYPEVREAISQAMLELEESNGIG